MSNEAIEILVEEIMRTRSDGNYEIYNNEELRDHYRKMLMGENDDGSC